MILKKTLRYRRVEYQDEKRERALELDGVRVWDAMQINTALWCLHCLHLSALVTLTTTQHSLQLNSFLYYQFRYLIS